jgi:hypothetical protein
MLSHGPDLGISRGLPDVYAVQDERVRVTTDGSFNAFESNMQFDQDAGWNAWSQA